MSPEDFKRQQEEYIMLGELESVFDQCVKYCLENGIKETHKNEWIHLSSRFQLNAKDRRQDIISNEDFRLERGKILHALIELLNRLNKLERINLR